MNNCFVLRQKNIKIRISTVLFSDTWTCWNPGDDGLGIGDQGRLGDKSFSQETKSTVQRQPSFGSRPELKSEVQDARATLAHFPLLFSGCL